MAGGFCKFAASYLAASWKCFLIPRPKTQERLTDRDERLCGETVLLLTFRGQEEAGTTHVASPLSASLGQPPGESGRN